MKVIRSLIVSTALLSVSLFMPSRTMLAQTSAVRARVTRPVDLHELATLRGNVHPLARPEFDTGVAPDDLPMERMLLVLQRGADQEAALRQLLDQQQVKSSPQFHQWLTPEQFGQQFGLADSDLQAVTDWLASQGFQVTKVAAGRTVIEFSGTAGLVRQVLGTEIHKFRVNGEDHWANTSDPQIPAALSPVVAGFASLNNFPRKAMSHSLGTFTRSKATGEVQPLFTYPVPCPNGIGNCYYIGVGPEDFAIIYNVLPLWNSNTDGTGQTIAVVGESNINPQDVTDFRTMFGLPANQPNIILNGPDPGINGDEREADLDVEWSGAVAKGATIDFVVSESTETTPGIDLSALYIIDNDLAPVMSESYGSCEASLGAGGNQFYSTLWEQAAAQGITVLMAAGDSGPAGCDGINMGETVAQRGLAVSGLASTPFNVAVGGTDFNINANNVSTYWSLTNTSPWQSSANFYIPEITWNDSCAGSGSLTGCATASSDTNFSYGVDLIAGGGGPSSCTNPNGAFPAVTCGGNYAKPPWQSGAGVPNDGARDIPDLSLFAGDGFHYIFYVVCQMDANPNAGGSPTSCDLGSSHRDFQAGSGTSASVQAFAGIMALVNQRYGRQGNANYVLYPMAAQNGASCNSSTVPGGSSNCIFYDITVGNNSVICVGGSPNCSNTSAGSGQYGVMVFGGSPAYSTTTGYDLATGLGSVNVANLVNHWNSNFTMPTTTLSLSTTPATNPITLTHGQPINFTVNVSSGSGTPTGDVSLIAHTSNSQNVSPTTGIGPFTLTGNSVSGSTDMLPGGSYNVTAHYSGNGTFAASDSSPGLPVTVSKESSQTELRLVTFDPASGALAYGNTTTAYGAAYVLRMDVMHASDNNPCAKSISGLISYPCPTGALTISPAPTEQNPPPGTTPGSYTLNSHGYAEDVPIQLLPGTYPFVASYAGDNSYTSSTSPTLPITITKAPTTISLMTINMTPLPLSMEPNDLSVRGILVTQSNGVAPTGTMQLLVNSVPAGNPVAVQGAAATSSANAAARADLYSSWLTAGNYEVSVQYSGDANYASSTSDTLSVQVWDFTLAGSASSLSISAPGQSTSLTVTLTSQNGFTGTVTFSAYGACASARDGFICTIAPGSLNLTGSAPASATVTINSTGSSSLQRRTPLPWLPAGPVCLWAGLMSVVLLLRRMAYHRATAVLMVASALLIMALWLACGGGNSTDTGNVGSNTPAPSPAVNITPASLTFGQVGVGRASAPQTVTLTNAGNATLAMGIVGATAQGYTLGDYIDFNDAVQDTCYNAVIPPGGTCQVSVAFVPQVTGLLTAPLLFNDNAPGSPQTVNLSGTGIMPPTPTGSYWVQVVAAAANNGIVHQLELPLTVQ